MSQSKTDQRQPTAAALLVAHQLGHAPPGTAAKLSPWVEGLRERVARTKKAGAPSVHIVIGEAEALVAVLEEVEKVLLAVERPRGRRRRATSEEKVAAVKSAAVLPCATFRLSGRGVDAAAALT